MRILLIRLSSLGDVVLATPIPRLLRNHFPEAAIDVVVAEEFADVWRANPRIDRVITVDRSRGPVRSARIVANQFATTYDVVIDLQRNVRSYFLRGNRAQRLLRYSKCRLQKLSLVWLKHSSKPLPHICKRYIDAIAVLGVTDDGEGLEVWLPEERGSTVYPPAQRRPPEGRILGIAPGARHMTKRWLSDRFVSVAQYFQKQQWQVILFGSNSERILCEQIASGLDPALTTIAAGCTIYDALRMVDRCTLVVSNDSAMVHLAAARRVPVVVIYGSTVPALGFTPYRVPHRIVEADVACRPCTHIGRSRCPLGHFECMQQVHVQSVVSAIETIVSMGASGEYQSR